MTKQHRHRWKVEDQTLPSGEVLHGKRCACGLWIRTDLFFNDGGFIPRIPKWALQKQKRTYRTKFEVGDIVYADPSVHDYMHHFQKGVAVVVEIDDEDCADYALDFGPNRVNGGYSAWYPEETLRMIRRKVSKS